MPTLAELYEPIGPALREVGAIFERALESDWPFVEQLCEHLRKLQGKMLRPGLLLLSGSASGQITHEHFTLAAVVEMVHIASLVHDDVLDEADIRRKAQTINRMTSNETAVMLGDFLTSRAFGLCTGLETQDASRIIARTASTLCEGELLQICNRGNWRLQERQYLTIIEMKTAVLTATACELGALYAGADADTVRHLYAYGRDLGIAFQIVDDVLDITGEEDETGKTLGTDLQKGKLTLPIIHYLQSQPAERRREALDLLQEAGRRDRNTLRKMLIDSGSIDYALDRAKGYTTRALHFLENLPDSPARDSLQAVPEFVVERHF